jgi:transcriptional regulator with XRE-family HTH domain
MTDREIKKKFGEHLRDLRKTKGLTQEELADNAGMHFTYVGQIERGIRNPSLVNLYKLAKALKITTGQLLPF